MASRKVGQLHAHSLPDPARVSKYDVYRCECNKEFYMETTTGLVTPKWYPVDSSPHLVQYSPEETDAPKIGRWTPKPEGGEQDGPTSMDDSAEQASESGRDGQTPATD